MFLVSLGFGIGPVWEWTDRREEEGVLLDFLIAPWAMVRCGLWVGLWLLVLRSG